MTFPAKHLFIPAIPEGPVICLFFPEALASIEFAGFLFLLVGSSAGL